MEIDPNAHESLQLAQQLQQKEELDARQRRESEEKDRRMAETLAKEYSHKVSAPEPPEAEDKPDLDDPDFLLAQKLQKEEEERVASLKRVFYLLWSVMMSPRLVETPRRRT